MTRGTDLSRAYFDDVVAPLLRRELPSLRYAAGRLGSGSDVLGFDDELSHDHDFGLRLNLLVPSGSVDAARSALEAGLPPVYAGHPTRFATTWHPEPALGAEVDTVADFILSRTGVDATRELGTDDWLSLTGQAVLEVTAGEVFADTDGTLTAARARLAWYPRDIWLYALAADWERIAQELPFLGRTADRGDELGSRLIGARLVHSVMHLAFLLERRWPPYSKWFGTAFGTLPVAAGLQDALTTALAPVAWRHREHAITEALDLLADRQRSLGLPSLVPATEPFFDRPYRGLRAIPALLRAAISDPVLRAREPLIGSPDQHSTNVSALMSQDWRRRSVGSDDR